MPMDAGNDRRRDRRQSTEEIIQAARAKFLRYGVNRTTMSDVATDVGRYRPAIYEYVVPRNDLVDVVLLQRFKEIAEALKSLANSDVSFQDAFIDTSVAAIEAARSDEELMNIFEAGPNGRVQDVVTGSFPEMHDIVVNLLGPTVQRGRDAGELRTDKTQDELIDWIRVIYLVLINPPASATSVVRSLVAAFLLPYIMFSSSADAGEAS